MAYTSSFLGLNTALRGLMAHQTALDMTGHNVSNISSEGYTRQRAEMAASVPHSLPTMTRTMISQLGTGVDITSLERLRDQYVDRSIRQQFGQVSYSSTSLGSLQQLERIIGEPSDDALAGTMRRFFNALEDVGSHPDDMAARASFAQVSDEVARQFRTIATQVGQLQTESDDRLNQTVIDVNAITAQIATLNNSIRDARYAGQQPNDLLDERDRQMDELSQKINYTYTTNLATSEVTITFGTTIPIQLVDPLVPGGFTAITRADLDTAYGNGDLTSGQAFADEELFNTTLPTYMANLDSLVNSMVTQLNAANGAGFDLTGAPGGNIFDAAGLTAASIQLDPVNNIRTNPALVAAASSWNPPGEPGNGGNAQAMLNLRQTVMGAPLNDTWEGYYATYVSGMGQQAKTVEEQLNQQQMVLDAQEGRRQQTSGVSMDEEMSNMMRFQHAYNASARVLTSMDEALDTIINRMGRVGL